ncbi:MAG: LAGLIDADG family homing endonuclease [Candidatus Woesearchaeota archaeon]
MKPEHLYEFYGILIGDGCISKYIYKSKIHYEIRIDGHAITDYDYYHDYLVNLISNVFDKRPKPGFRKQCLGIYIHFRSEQIASFLTKTFNFPYGKKGEIGIQKEIFEDFNKLKYVLRGLFDTDGCLYFTKNNSKLRSYPIIEISSHSTKLINQLKSALRSIGFIVKTSHYEDSIKLHGRKNLLKWMEIIGTSHPDKASKFEFWKKYGYCPRIDELDYKSRLKILVP